MANYVDGFVIPIKKKNVKAYKKIIDLGSRDGIGAAQTVHY